MSLGSILLLALLFVTIGFIGGALITMAFSDRSTETKSSSVKKEEEIRPEKYKRLISLYRDSSSGGLILEIGGRSYQKSSQFSEKERRGLAVLAREWLDWLGVSNNPSKQPKAPASQSQPEAMLLSQSAERFPKAAKQSVQLLAPAAKTQKQAVSGLENPAAATIVGQIDEILQERLAGSSLEGRNIKLTEDTREGVVVWIGTDRYLGVDAVPDPEVRQEIKAAVSTWEQRMDQNRS